MTEVMEPQMRLGTPSAGLILLISANGPTEPRIVTAQMRLEFAALWAHRTTLASNPSEDRNEFVSSSSLETARAENDARIAALRTLEEDDPDGPARLMRPSVLDD